MQHTQREIESEHTHGERDTSGCLTRVRVEWTMRWKHGKVIGGVVAWGYNQYGRCSHSNHRYVLLILSFCFNFLGDLEFIKGKF